MIPQPTTDDELYSVSTTDVSTLLFYDLSFLVNLAKAGFLWRQHVRLKIYYEVGVITSFKMCGNVGIT